MSIESLVHVKANPKIPDIAPGDTVRVSSKIVEGDKERIQVFQGVVIRLRRGGAGASFTVRHVAYGVGVERTFPFYSPLIAKVEIVRHGKVRRAKLYYLRSRSGKSARIKERRVIKKKPMAAPEAEAELVPETEQITEAEPITEELVIPESEQQIEQVNTDVPITEQKTETKQLEADSKVEETISEQEPESEQVKNQETATEALLDEKPAPENAGGEAPAQETATEPTPDREETST